MPEEIPPALSLEEFLAKEAKKAEKKRQKEEEKRKKAEEKARKAAEAEAARAAKAAGVVLEVPDVTLMNYSEFEFGNLFIQSHVKTDREWMNVNDLTADQAGKSVWIRARVHASRKQGNKLCFIELRRCMASVQAVCFGKEIAQFAGELSKETIVDVFGELTSPPEPINGCTQKNIEVQIKKIFAVSRSSESLPLQVDDAGRSQAEIERLTREDPEYKAVIVTQDTRLNNRIIDLRTRANQAIFRIQSGVGLLFREFLAARGFTEIHSPKIIAAASEGGADVFKLQYFGNDAFLAQSPQLYKQMALMGDMERVFEVGPVFRSEKSFTHRHLTEFTGLDLEMTFDEHYGECLDVMDGMFNHIFNGLNTRYKDEVEAVRAQFPFKDLKFSNPCLRFKYPDAMALLRENGPAILEERILVEKCPETLKRMRAHLELVKVHGEEEDMSTEDEKLLGEVIRRKFDQEFYIIDKFPSALRPFYTMEDPEDSRWSNSYDIFIRGEEVMSGAQRIHDASMLLKRAETLGVDLSTISSYVDSFRFGAFPHAGGGVGLERVVMLFLQLSNIRSCSLFPRDPKRCSP